MDAPINIDSVTDKVRILVLGDPSVGKTCLVHLLCNDEPCMKTPTPTVGFNAQVMIHTHARTKKPYWIELIDVTGSRSPLTNTSKSPVHSTSLSMSNPSSPSPHPSNSTKIHHTNSAGARNALYSQVNGLMLVHDACFKTSYRNLWAWIGDAFNRSGSGYAGGGGGGGSGYGEIERRGSAGGKLRADYSSGSFTPILLVGTKVDLLPPSSYDITSSTSSSAPISATEPTGAARPRRYSIADEYGGDWVNLSTKDSNAISPISPSGETIAKFFDKVIDGKFHTLHHHYHPSRHHASTASLYASSNFPVTSNSAVNISASTSSLSFGTEVETQRRRHSPAGLSGLPPDTPSHVTGDYFYADTSSRIGMGYASGANREPGRWRNTGGGPTNSGGGIGSSRKLSGGGEYRRISMNALNSGGISTMNLAASSANSVDALAGEYRRPTSGTRARHPSANFLPAPEDPSLTNPSIRSSSTLTDSTTRSHQ